MYMDGVYVGLGEGIPPSLPDESDEIAKIIDFVRRKYTPARQNVAPGRKFTPALTTEIKREQEIFVREGRLKAGEFLPGVINLAWKYASGYLKREVLLPLYFSVEGHMSDMWIGPVAHVGEVLRHEGRALHFPTHYNRFKKPFDNQSGIDELARRVGATVQDNGVKFPSGTPFCLGGFSQGALIMSRFYMEYLAPGRPLDWRLKDLRGVVSVGSPYREKGVVAEWVPDPPAPDRQGISDVRMQATPVWWKEVARKGDLYTDNQSEGEIGLNKTAIYKIIAENQWSGGPAAILSRVVDFLTLPDDLIPIAMSIINGMIFLGNMDKHTEHNMDPAIAFLRERLATAG